MQLEREEHGAIKVDIENATRDQEKIQREYGFKTHGMVFLDSTGTRVLKTLDGHMMTNEEIQQALNEVLASQGAGSS